MELDFAKLRALYSLTPLGGTSSPQKTTRSKVEGFQFPKEQKEKLMLKLGLVEREKFSSRPETDRAQYQKAVLVRNKF